MKKIVLSLVAFAFYCLVSFGAFAQIKEIELDVPTGNLPTTSQLNTTLQRSQGDILGNGSSDAGNIYYGANPTNPRAGAPVLVFIHGYSSRASTWWENNDMYTRAYNDGYRTAFVSVHPDKNMWVNGQLFRDMLNTVANRYGVSRVVVVAHSKGGLDSDAALVHYGATSRVERVITLGSPHFGTPLADLAQSGWVWWLSNVFGQVNDATYSLQTGYASYFRSQTDSHPNRPNARFRTVGAWGYGGILWFSGVYLNLNGGSSSTGGNDGVVPYYSTKRPNSIHLLGGHGTAATDLDHSEVHKGQYMWQYVKANLPTTLAKEQAQNLAPEPVKNPNAIVESFVQVISTKEGKANLVVEKNTTELLLDIHHLSEADDFVLIAPNGETMRPEILRSAEIVQMDMLGGYVTTLRLEGENLQSGTYTLASRLDATPFVALVNTGTQVGLRLTSDLNDEKWTYRAGEPIALNLQVLAHQPLNAQGAKVTGVISLTSDAEGFDRMTAPTYVVEFEEKAGVYSLHLPKGLPQGLYNLAIHAENGNFSKSLVSSFAVVENTLHQLGTSQKEDETKKASSLRLEAAYPNPMSSQTTVVFENQTLQDVVVSVYDAKGRRVAQQILPELNLGKHQYQWQAEGAENGLYIIEIRTENERLTQKVILEK
ncbi:alpha/beta fold hydrolase [Hugenholtzia roseola]|uniref:alpha/beta fold hydrolase n=1 Tax=Hugenholtzia roseola TaxID=1002 RepID=UPI001377FBD4|nr:alpha/beta fold hydrolase [Hugenholtzia roseola]